MIESMFDKTVDVYRLSDDESPSDIDTESYAVNLTGVACNIQPLDDSYRESIGGGYEKDYRMFCVDCDIVEKDRIIDDLDEYEVTGVKRLSFMGDSHLQLTITKKQ